MRLIDADKLLKQLEWLDIDDFILYEEVKEDIDESPTVEAIPIDWIKNYASHKASKDLIDCYWHFWEDDVLKMVSDWEKENARD